MMTHNLLYVHGYNGSMFGSSATLIKKYLPADFKFFSMDYNQEDADVAVGQIQQFISENSIDIVVGSSLGGFLALASFEGKKVVYNPCYLPSIELPLIGCDINAANTYKKYEHKKFKDSALYTRGIFTTDDELLGTKYVKMFLEDHGAPVQMVLGLHKMSETNLVNTVLPTIVSLAGVTV